MDAFFIKHLQTSDVVLKINPVLDNFDRIVHDLNSNKIPFQLYESKKSHHPDGFVLGFGLGCDFLDVYSIVSLFEKYELECIYILRSNKNDLIFGTYLPDVWHSNYYQYYAAYSDIINIDDFLNINPYLSLQNVIDLHFNILEEPDRVPSSYIGDEYDNDDYYSDRSSGDFDDDLDDGDMAYLGLD